MKKWEFVTVRLMIFLRTIKEIRKGHIKIFEDIKCIDGRTIYFSDEKVEDFDAIVAATGYYSNYSSIIKLEKAQIDDVRKRISKQNFFGKNGFYFCGFFISPMGAIHEITSEAKKIAKDISGKQKINHKNTAQLNVTMSDL